MPMTRQAEPTEEALLKAGALQRAILNSANFSSIATDANGVITTLTYDAAARILTRTVDPDGLAIVTRSA